MFTAPSVTSLRESEILRWILRQPFPLVRDAFGVHGPRIADFEVTHPIYAPAERKTSEIDAILRPLGDPSHAVAIQAKRIRAAQDTFHTGQLGHLRELPKAAKQVNHDLERGFHKAILTVIVQVDSRERSGGQWLGGGLSPELTREVRNAIQSLELDPRAGIVVFEFDQPVDKEVMLGGGFGCTFHREAIGSVQAQWLTEAVTQLDGIQREGRLTWNQVVNETRSITWVGQP